MSATLRLTHKTIGVEVRRGTYDAAVDGKHAGTLELNGTIEIPVEPGRHTLQVRSGRNSSRTKTFDVAEGEIASFRCSGKSILPIFLLSFVVPSPALSLKREWTQFAKQSAIVGPPAVADPTSRVALIDVRGNSPRWRRTAVGGQKSDQAPQIDFCPPTAPDRVALRRGRRAVDRPGMEPHTSLLELGNAKEQFERWAVVDVGDFTRPRDHQLIRGSCTVVELLDLPLQLLSRDVGLAAAGWPAPVLLAEAVEVDIPLLGTLDRQPAPVDAAGKRLFQVVAGA